MRWTSRGSLPFRALDRLIRQIAEQFALWYALNLRGLLQAVVPEEFHGAHGTACRKIVPDDRFFGELEVADAFLLNALDTGGCAELQRHVRGSKNVARHVAQRAATEIVKAAPVERLVEIPVLVVVGSSGGVRSRFGNA